MAKHVLYDAFVSIGGTDLTDHVHSISYELNIEGQQAAAMGEAQSYEMAGVSSISDIQIEYYQDFAASKTWASHKAMWTGRSTASLIVKPASGAESATNPAFTVAVFVKKLPAVTGSRGDRHMAPVTYGVAGALTIDETP